MRARQLLLPLLVAASTLSCSKEEEQRSVAGGEPTSPPADSPEVHPEEPFEDPAPADRPPEILFDVTRHDFGAVSDVESPSFSFSFMNVGDETLTITEIDASCGCTPTVLEQKEYAPGEVGEIGVSWDFIGWGPQQKTIDVHSNSANTPVVVLTVAADISPFVTTSPPTIDFGAVRNAEERRLEFELRCQDPVFSVVDIRPPSDQVEMRLLGEPRDGVARMEAILHPSTRTGTFVPSVAVTVRGRPPGYDHDVEHEATVKARANLYRELLAEPAFFSMGRVRPGARFEKRVRLSRPDADSFSILDARITNAGIAGLEVEVLPVSGTAAAYDLVVSGTAGSTEQKFNATLVLTTDVPEESTRNVSIMGAVGR